MSNAMGGALPRFQSLDRLIEQDASALVVRRSADGQGLDAESSFGMAFSSGVHRVFGSAKSDSDVQANRASLTALLNQIQAESSKFVRDHVEAGMTRLGGDGQDHSVIDRMKRGTYVSSDLVAQLKTLAVEGAIAEVRHDNANGLHEFMSRERGDDFDRQNGLAYTADSCGVVDLLDRLKDEGSEDWPIGEYPRSWQELRNYADKKTAAGTRPQDDPIMAGLGKHLEKLVQTADSQNRRLTKADFEAAATSYLAQPKVFRQFVALANLDLGVRVLHDQHSIADTVRQWGEGVDEQEIGSLQPSDWAWLADQIEENDFLEMPQESVLGSFKQFLTNRLLRSEERQIPDLCIRLCHAIEKGLQTDTAALRGKSLAEVSAFVKEQAHPRELAEKDMARLMTPVIKPLLLERRERMDRIDKAGAEFRRLTEGNLQRRVGTFPELADTALTVDRRQLASFSNSSARVDTVKGFIEATILQPILGAENQQDMATHLAGRRPEDLSPDEAMDLTRTTRDLVEMRRETWQARLDGALPALDRFADLQQQLGEIDRKGGLAEAGAETWSRIDATVEEIRSALPLLRQLAENLADGHGTTNPLIAKMAAALNAAADQMERSTEPYRALGERMSAAQDQRRLVHLPEIQDLANRLMGDGGKSSAKAPPSTIVKTAFTVARSEVRLSEKVDLAVRGWADKAGPLLDRFADFAIRAEHPERHPGIEAERRAIGKEVTQLASELRSLRSTLGSAGEQPPFAALLGRLERTIGAMSRQLAAARLPGTDMLNPMPRPGEGAFVRGVTQLSDGLKAARAFVVPGPNALRTDYNRSLAMLGRFGDFSESFAEMRSRRPLPTADDRAELGRLDVEARQLEAGFRNLDGAIQGIDMLIGMMEDRRSVETGGPERYIAGRIAQLKDLRAALEEQSLRMRETLADFAAYRGDLEPHAALFTVMKEARDGLGTQPSTVGRSWVPVRAEITRLLQPHAGPEFDRARELLGPALQLMEDLGSYEAAAQPILDAGRSPTHGEWRMLGHGRERMEQAREALRELVASLPKLGATIAPDGGTGPEVEAWTAVASFLTDVQDTVAARAAVLDRGLNAAAALPGQLG
jgi:hypothetical protein